MGVGTSGFHRRSRDVSASGQPRIVRAHGSRLFDDRGRDYIDGISGATCNNLGHGIPEMLSAMHKKAALASFAHRTQFASQPIVDLTREILNLTGAGYREVLYTDSGPAAIKLTLDLVRRHHALNDESDRPMVLTQRPSHQGSGVVAFSIAGRPAHDGSAALGRDSPASWTQRAAPNADQLGPDLDDWQLAFDRVGHGRVAAVLVEPMGSADSGATALSDETLSGLRELCDANGALLVADETLTGLGQVGDWFGHSSSGVTPDLIVMGPGLNAGCSPIGACVVGQNVRPQQLCTGATALGPSSAVTAHAVLRFTKEQNIPERARQMGAFLKRELEALAAPVYYLGEPRGRGLLFTLPVLTGPRLSQAKEICATAINFGLMLRPTGVDRATEAVIVAPPLTIATHEMNLLVDRLRDTLRNLANSMG
ncbi:adenosylmethionine-8-amino-7-oxononanoate aminotransferase [Frankia casuarinae]|uniref:Aminotransferase n=1 Tax=Frankia casuarinae (strain DSM 45818 / CECT 9043 / HFP020203 / CcI3) TaxID=106370 RepID=Q2JBA2_FRACC|nr:MULTISPECIES: aminotransferase class III-fold pyridoxal phosphate-dependent enzyme [Frankia]ABD11440.1 aminotransferase [Frankia casuarinae]ETA00355.1 adenosylmethionine-8-amino-7-oxononanoate aminotransferase [Frankia sp. CcI6]EYT89890.1 adenosylmethionine-8-amino-7-oxononanoate aminotransferase [Frankia casuarinae]KDA40653.1 adenosylmethionine-8-amino-7-oxononanoate aminotransferase [Frankia sp. BMG5.23]KFB02716.1 adenosylmethionine-8-amino-7-oxononanoate aminotransferase [Frankia sp. All